jgi:hypothetical protein
MIQPDQARGDEGQVPWGEPIAPHGVPQHAVPTGLPPGVHPLDPSIPHTGGPITEPHVVPLDEVRQDYHQGKAPFDVDNVKALPVYQRASHDWTANYLLVSNTIQGIGRQPGRSSVTIDVPSTGTAVIIAPTQGEVDQSDGITLNPGDSRTIYTEAPVWIGPAVSGTIGTANVQAEYNPVGGSLGSF